MPLRHSSSARALSRILQWAEDFDRMPLWALWTQEEVAEAAAAIRASVGDDIIIDTAGLPWVVGDARRCDTCGARPGGCECVLCRHCAEDLHCLRLRRSCSGCDEATCHAECTCSDEPEPEPEFDRPTFATRELAFRGQAKQNPARYCGLELEISGWADAHAIERAAARIGASIVEDGSIGEGVELVTQPTRGDQLRADLRILLDDATRADDSCGLHAHVDARDFGPWELRRLTLLYCILEPALHALYPSREGGSYSARVRPWGSRLAARPKSTDALRSTLWGLLYPDERGREIRAAKRNKYRASRYKALNLHSWCYRKTVEFRLAEGTVDPTLAYAWACLCAAIVERAYRLTDSATEALYTAASFDAAGTAGAVYGGLLATLPEGCADALEALKGGN
jgi:hypothetical protein